jgi:hypothetical protein
MHDTATAALSEGLVFGGGLAGALNETRPSLALVDPPTGKVTRTMPSVAGRDR